MKHYLPLFFVLSPLNAFAGDAVTFQHKPIEKPQTVIIESAQTLNINITVTSGETVLANILQNNSSTDQVIAKISKWSSKKKRATFTYGDNSETSVQEINGQKQEKINN